MNTHFRIDGIREPKLEPVRLELLDEIGLARRQAPAPLVKEGLSMAQWIEAGGWIPTVPGELE